MMIEREDDMVIKALRWIGAVVLPFPAYFAVCFQ